MSLPGAWGIWPFEAQLDVCFFSDRLSGRIITDPLLDVRVHGAPTLVRGREPRAVLRPLRVLPGQHAIAVVLETPGTNDL